MIPGAERIPPTCDAGAHSHSDQPNHTEPLHRSNNNWVRSIAQGIGAERTGGVAQERLLGSFRGIRGSVCIVFAFMGVTDRLVQ